MGGEARPPAIVAARRVSTPTSVRRYAVVPRLSSIGLAAALAAAPARCNASSSRWDPMSACAASGTSRTVGATAAIATRAAVHTPCSSNVTLTAAPATAIYHLGPGDEPQIGVCGPRCRTWDQQGDKQISAFQYGPSGAHGDVFNVNGSIAIGSDDHGARTVHDERTSGVGGRRAVAQIAADCTSPLNLSGADELNGLDKPRPEAFHVRVFADDGRRGGRTEPHLLPIDRDTDQLEDTLEIDKGRGAPRPHAVLNEQIRAPGQRLCVRVGLHQANGVGNGYRGFVTRRPHYGDSGQGL